MKRFYCTICKKYKRVRVMPDSVTRPQEKNPQERRGTCKWHSVASKKASA